MLNVNVKAKAKRVFFFSLGSGVLFGTCCFVAYLVSWYAYHAYET